MKNILDRAEESVRNMIPERNLSTKDIDTAYKAGYVEGTLDTMRETLRYIFKKFSCTTKDIQSVLDEFENIIKGDKI